MLLQEKQFYTEELDYTIPEMQKVKELYEAGDVADAEHAFAEYLKANLNLKPFLDANRDEADDSTEKKRATVEEADKICRGIVTVLKYTYDFGGDIDWNFNGTPDGYREWLWKLNGHGSLVTLGQAYLITGDEKYAVCFNRNMNNWIDCADCPQWPVPNRCALYPQWRTIESGGRQRGRWPQFIHAFLHSPSIPDKTWVRIAMSIWEHAQLLMYSPSSVNWLTTELAGLHTIGTLYRFYRLSETWRTHALNMQADEFATQVYEDGFHCELASGYQSVVITNGVSMMEIARRYGFEVPEALKQAVRRLFTMYPKLMRPDGKIPGTNDGSEGPVAPAMKRGLKYFPGDPDFTAVLEGRAGEIYPRDIVLPYAGMITMRTGWGENDVWAFFESAPFGAGHQHNDKLNMNVFAYGKSMINVIGNYPYDGSVMRHYVKHTRAHNSGLVDGRGQNAGPTHTKWSSEKVNIKSDLEVNINEDTVVAYGKYNRGYGKDLVQVTHERKIVFFRHGIDGSRPFFVVLDSFTPNDDAKHTYEVSFQLYPIPVTLRGRRATLDCGDGVTMEIVTHASLCTVTAQYEPDYMGFRPATDRLAKEHTPAPVLIIKDGGDVKHFATVLYPTPDGVAPEIGVTCDDESFTVTLDGVEHRFDRKEDFLTTKPV